ncbi:MAG: 3'-5' exonuclease, partial [Nanoarchaeota archaeon]
RTHQQSSMLKKQLEYEEIPFTSINRDSLLKTDIIKTVRAYLTILDKLITKSKGGDGAWWDLIHNTLKNKNDKLIFGQTIKSLKEEECMSLNLIEEKIQGLSEQGEIQVQTIIKNINGLLNNQASPIEEITKKIFAFLSVEDNEESNKNELPTLEKFHAFVKEFVETDSKELNSLIHHLNTIDALDISIESPILIKDGIRIMTNHATKGLEYEVVIMSSLVQKKFPIEKIGKQDEKENEEESIKKILSLDSGFLDVQGVHQTHLDMNKQIMEERRLCYVGFTRTKKRLYLTYAKEYGQRAFQESQFLKEINYQNNPVIDFIKDDSELYQTPKEKTPFQNIPTQKQIIKFSPSSLQLFDECQKRYEMKYIYHMPDPIPQSWEAMTIGNFIHRVLEQGVKSLCKTLKDFEDCAKIVQMEGYEDVNLNEATNLIKVFFERNNKKYNENSKTEQPLQIVIDGLIFNGFADRIDINDEGDLTIIDYKTGKSEIKPKYRNWQLGIYALASKQYGKPKTLILEMLQKEYPLEFILNEQGIAKEIHSPRTQFSLEEVKTEIVNTAKNIMQARVTGFKSCPIEKNCQFCEEWAK